jgi:MoaA/NifB/PqqE/SkfB family radical SAM enzyme
MYVQVTNRCNMTCEHCCFSCTASGKDMTRETFIQCCEFAYERGDTFFIGGGEPTLHPLLFDFIGIALSYDFEGSLGLVTNGKLTMPAMRIARMARNGIISADLSQDSYHEPIDPKVVQAFKRPPTDCFSRTENRDFRGIRSGADNVVYAIGKAEGFGEDGCACSELLATPTGQIFGCGCLTRKMGTVFAPRIPEDHEPDKCYRNEAALTSPI